MARYISQHTLACPTRQGAAELARQFHTGSQVKARRVLVNMQEGKCWPSSDAPSREELEKWLGLTEISFRLAASGRV